MVTSSIYRTRSYTPTLQWGPVNGTRAGKRRDSYSRSLHCLSASHVHAYTVPSIVSLPRPRFHNESTMLFSWVLSTFLILLLFNNRTNINGTYMSLHILPQLHVHTLLDCSTRSLAVEQNDVPKCFYTIARGECHESCSSFRC